jgi:hypothetical protein
MSVDDDPFEEIVKDGHELIHVVVECHGLGRGV